VNSVLGISKHQLEWGGGGKGGLVAYLGSTLSVITQEGSCFIKQRLNVELQRGNAASSSCFGSFSPEPFN